MSERKIDLKTPWVAGVLAFLVPGAGHFYQGRNVKAAIYFFCILGTFFCGMNLGEWRPVYWTENPAPDKFGRAAKKNLGFFAQAGVGTPGILAYLQSRRYHRAGNFPTLINVRNDHRDPVREIPLSEIIDAKFVGVIVTRDRHDPQKVVLETVTGQLHLEPLGNRTFRGTLKTDKTTLQLGDSLIVDRRILGDPGRYVSAGVVNDNPQNENETVSITGKIPRSFANWFLAPVDDRVLEDLNRRLNKRFEMALVFTWIAGLLNILAVWDAVQGPAYGYGDEPSPDEESTDKIDPAHSSSKDGKKAARVEETSDEGEDDPPPNLAEAAVGEPAVGEPASPGETETPREETT